MIKIGSDLEAYCDPDKREVSHPEAMAKHGKCFITPTQFEALTAIGERRKVLGLNK